MSRYCITRALRIALLAMISAFAFQTTKHIICPNISLWGSRVLAILSVTAATFVASIVMLRREEKSCSVLLNEIERRRKAEQQLQLQAPALESAPTPIVITGRDGTIVEDSADREHSELEVRRLSRALSTLSRCNGVLVHATDEAQLLSQICEIVVKSGAYRLAWVGYAEHDSSKSVQVMAKAGFDDGYINKAQISWSETERGCGPTGTAIRTGNVCIARDILHNPQFIPWRSDALRRGYASNIALPLREGSQIIGTLTIYAHEPDAFDTPEVELLNELADDLSYGIESLRNAAERRRSEAALRESEKRYRMLFARNPHPMWLCDVNSLAFLEVNDAAINKYGYARQEFLEMTLADIRPLEDLPILLEALSQAEDGYTYSGSFRHRKKDGTIIDVETAAYRFLQDGKMLSLALANDVTERKRAAETVRCSEEHLRSFVEESPFGIFRTDLREDRFLSVNPALVAMLGYGSSEELLSTRVSTDIFFNSEDREKILATLLRNRSFNGIEAPFWREDGKIITAYLSGRMVQDSLTGTDYFEGIVEDITERNQAEQALRESEERFRQVVEGAPVGMFIETDGIFRYFNPAAVAILGAESASQIVGKGFLEIVHPDSRAAVTERARIVREEKKSVPFMEERLLRLDGTAFDGEVTAVPSIFEARSGALVFVRDITGRKREEADRRSLEEQLRQAQKMEAVGRLAGGIAHDFNNLLMVIQSFTEMMQDNLPARSTLRKNTQEIMKAAKRAASLTGQMLAFSRKQITSPVVLDLNAVINDTAKMLKRLIGEDIEFRVDEEMSLWAIEADPDQIVQVLMNLCVNSRDAMPQGGALTIATGNISIEEGSIEYGLYLPPGEYVKLSVTDTGAGISQEEQEHIFEPFFTTKEVGKGTGLGLAMVYGIVKQSCGYVGVDSKPEQGASFTIYLPRTKGTIVSDMCANADAQLRGTETLLVAEDEDALRQAMCDYLRNLGYTVLEAGSGQQALSAAGEHLRQIDLLITDVVMPKMSGTELSQMLKGLNSDLNTIYMSGYTDDAVLRHGIHKHDAAFLQKPFSLGALARKVRDALGRTQTEAGLRNY